MVFVEKLDALPTGRDNKHRHFMFAYYGEYIQRDIHQVAVEQVDNGIYNGDIKYCVIKMYLNKGRRESSLRYIIDEYNAAVGLEGHITLVALPIAAGRVFPIIMLSKLWRGNPIEVKRDMDKRSHDPLFRSFFSKKEKIPASAAV